MKLRITEELKEIQNKENRTADGQGKIAAKEDIFNKWKRIVATFMVNTNRYYKDTHANIKDLLELSALLGGHEKFPEWLNTVRNEYGVRHAPIIAYAGALKGGHSLNLRNVDIWRTPKDILDTADFLKQLFGYLPARFKKHAAKKLEEFDEYQLSKYKSYKAGNFKLVDIVNLVHPKANENLTKLVYHKLPAPDTWENLISNPPQGWTRKQIWEDLMKREKLPALAFIRNLRNMINDGVDRQLIKEYIMKINTYLIFPYQILVASLQLLKLDERELAKLLVNKLSEKNVSLLGKTLLILDVSGSMGYFDYDLLRSSNMKTYGMYALGTFYAIIGASEDVTVYLTAGDDGKKRHATIRIDKEDFIDPFKFMKNIDEVYRRKIGRGGIFTYQAIKYIEEQEGKNKYDRIIVISDSQDINSERSTNSLPKGLLKDNGKIYLNNIAAYKNVGYSNDERQIEINTFSDKIVDFIRFEENFN